MSLTIVVIFITSVPPTINGSIQFSLLSTSRDTDPPVLTLSFNVTNIPPSTVTCSVNGVMIDIPNEDIDRAVTEAQYNSDMDIITSVLVTVYNLEYFQQKLLAKTFVDRFF